MSDDILATLNLDPAEVPDLSPGARQSLVAYLLRWDTIRIAATHPVSLVELRAIKGIGPCKLEQYGQAILDVVAAPNPAQTGESASNHHTC